MSQQKKRILFYYLSAFSNIGGIEKFNQCFVKALNILYDKGIIQPSIISVYDTQSDERYTRDTFFKGFGKRKLLSALVVLKQAMFLDVVILGHVNLLGIGLLIKLLRPKCKLVLVAHGIESWKKFYLSQRWAIMKCDLILAVSTYTKNQIVLRNNIDAKKIQLFPNTLDPFFKVPDQFERPGYLAKRYGLKEDQRVIFTLSRLFWSEQNKGYDKIISSLPKILERFPNTIYILGGKFDEREKDRIDNLLDLYNVRKYVLMPGYISDSEKTDHYLLADVFVLPSRKEGFGIVFLEALACGTQVIGGNQDGTVDALQNGLLGNLINPRSESDIKRTIEECLVIKEKPDPLKLQQSVIANYHFSLFSKRLQNLLSLN